MECASDASLNQLSRQVIGAGMEVANQLGAGFLEKVYENALSRELSLRGHHVECQKAIPVSYKGHCVGEYLADLVVDRRLLVELKCVRTLCDEHTAQCLNYLAATGFRICLLLNFYRPRLEVRRIIR